MPYYKTSTNPSSIAIRHEVNETRKRDTERELNRKMRVRERQSERQSERGREGTEKIAIKT